MNTLKEKATKILNFWNRSKRMPTYSEIADMFNFKSKDTAWRLVSKLIKNGSLQKDSKGKILPVNLDREGMRILGLVEAGFGSPAEENELDRIRLDEWLIEDEDRSFMLKVKGDSMIDAGIHAGDYCIVEKTSKAIPGQIVVAEIDGTWTIKYLRLDQKGFYLEAANKEYKSVRPKSDLKISAVVKAIVRKY